MSAGRGTYPGDVCFPLHSSSRCCLLDICNAAVCRSCGLHLDGSCTMPSLGDQGLEWTGVVVRIVARDSSQQRALWTWLVELHTERNCLTDALVCLWRADTAVSNECCGHGMSVEALGQGQCWGKEGVPRGQDHVSCGVAHPTVLAHCCRASQGPGVVNRLRSRVGAINVNRWVPNSACSDT